MHLSLDRHPHDTASCRAPQLRVSDQRFRIAIPHRIFMQERVIYQSPHVCEHLAGADHVFLRGFLLLNTMDQRVSFSNFLYAPPDALQMTMRIIRFFGFGLLRIQGTALPACVARSRGWSLP